MQVTRQVRPLLQPAVLVYVLLGMEAIVVVLSHVVSVQHQLIRLLQARVYVRHVAQLMLVHSPDNQAMLDVTLVLQVTMAPRLVWRVAVRPLEMAITVLVV